MRPVFIGSLILLCSFWHALAQPSPERFTIPFKYTIEHRVQDNGTIATDLIIHITSEESPLKFDLQLNDFRGNIYQESGWVQRGGHTFLNVPMGSYYLRATDKLGKWSGYIVKISENE